MVGESGYYKVSLRLKDDGFLAQVMMGSRCVHALVFTTSE